MQDLPIRKIPGIGRVSERLLDSIGVKVRCGCVCPCRRTFIVTFDAYLDLRRRLQMSRRTIIIGQTIWPALNASNTLGYRI
jgi:hypothetical protein